MHPRIPKRIMATLLMMCAEDLLLSQYTRRLMRGGKMMASVDELMAPSNEMNNSSRGTASANKTDDIQFC